MPRLTQVDADKAQLSALEKRTKDLNKATEKYLKARSFEEVEERANKILEDAKQAASDIMMEAEGLLLKSEQSKESYDQMQESIESECLAAKACLNRAEAEEVVTQRLRQDLEAQLFRGAQAERDIEKQKEYLRGQIDNLRGMINQWIGGI